MQTIKVIFHLTFIIFSIFSSLLHASIIEEQEVNVVIDENITKMDVKARVTLEKSTKGPLQFVLNGSTTGLKISSDGNNLTYQFERDNKPSIYFDGGLLTIPADSLKTGNVIEFNYTLDIAAVNYWRPDNISKGLTTKNGFEVGMYTAWLPTELSNGNFNFTVKVTAPHNFKALGNGAISTLENNIWQITSNQRQFDVPLIVSDRLETEVYDLGTNMVEVSHFGKPKAEVDNLAIDIESILTLFKSQFGLLEQSGVIRFAFVPRSDVASYSRKGFTAINTSGSELGRFSTIAHEISHFWWTGADSSLWEDWLNESFAEFSALTAIKHKYGEDAFIKRLHSYKKVSQDSPAIWGVDRKSDISTLVLYRKGPVIIEETKHRIGDKKFTKLLQVLNSLEIKNTQNFLNEIALITNDSERKWLETQLHR